MHGLCLNGLHGIHLNLKRLVVLVDILFMIHVHFMLDHIIVLCGVICVNTSAHSVSSCPFYACYAHLDLSLLLTQCTELEGGEPFGYTANFGMNYDLCGVGRYIR